MELDLTTERLLLRPVALSGIDQAIKMFTDPAVMKYVGEVKTPDEIIDRMPTWVKRGGGGCIGVWCVVDRQTGEKFGAVFLLPQPIEEDDTNWDLVVPNAMPDGDVEVGFFLEKSAWGKGYATEACRRLLRFAFEETPLDEVVATLYLENVSSRHVLEKCGLVYKGMRRAYGDECPDFRLTRKQWIADFKQH